MNGEILFLTIGQAAAELGISRAYAYRLARVGRIPAVRRGRRVLVPREAWRRWLQGQTEAALAAVRESRGPR